MARVLLRGKKGELDLTVGCDQVNTPKVFIDRYGREVKFVEYDSFGNVESDSLPELFIPIGFAGGLFDRDTGLVRFGFRDYDPFAGRFTCPDPAKDMRGDGDLYDYCVDDPVNMHDPNGLWTKETFAESKVKRGDDGKFSGSGGGGASGQSRDPKSGRERTVAQRSGSTLPSGENFVKMAAIVQAGSPDDRLNKFERLLEEYEEHLHPRHTMPDLSEQVNALEKLPLSFSQQIRFEKLKRRVEALRKKLKKNPHNDGTKNWIEP